jgi:hypothetical protein
MRKFSLILLGFLLTIPFWVHGQNSSLWKFVGNLRPVVSTWRVDAPGGASGASLTVSNLRSCNTIDTNAVGVLSCGTDETGAGGGGAGTGSLQNFFDNRYVRTAGDTMTGGLLIHSTNDATKSVDVGFLLEIAGAASGRTLHAQDSLRSSGSFIVDGSSVYFNSFANCNLDTVNGLLTCGSDADTTYSVGQGLSLNGTVISLSASHSGTTIEAVVLLSGSTVYGAESVRSSGSLVWEGTASGARLRGIGLTDCDASTSKLLWDTTSGTFSCGTDLNTGSSYSAGQGLTLNGANAFSLSSSFSGTALEIVGTASGRILHAQDQLRSSGSLIVDGSTVYLNSFANCTALETVNGLLTCGTDDGGTVTAGQGITVNGSVVSLSSSFSGTALEIIGTASGRILHAQDQLRSSGSLTIEGSSTFQSYMDIIEINAPTETGADTVRLFSYDDNSNTRLAYLLPDGTNVQIARDNIFVMRNREGSTVTKGKVVYISGGQGATGTAEFKLARADSTATTPVMGIVMESIINNSYGRVMVAGKLTNFNTNAFSEGDVVYLSASVAGDMTATSPVHPNIAQRLGVIINKHATLGTMAFLPVGRDGIQTGTNSQAFEVGDTVSGDVTMTFDGDAGVDGSFTWDVSEDEFLFLNNIDVLGTASGRILHAQDTLRSSGGLLVDGSSIYLNAFNCQDTEANGGVLTVGSDGLLKCEDDDGGGATVVAAQGLTLVSAGVIRLSDSFSGTSLEIMGTASGRIVHAQDLLRSSGSLAIEGASWFGGALNITQGALSDSSIVSADIADGTVTADDLGTDSVSADELNASGVAAELEAVLNHDNLVGFVANEHIDHSLVVLTAGQGITGGGNITASRVFTLSPTHSGTTIFATTQLRSSGSLSVEGHSYLQSALVLPAFPSCTALETSSSGNLICGTDDVGTIVAGQGITVAGSVVRLTAAHSGTTISATTLLSGAIVHGQNQLRSSGSLTVQTTGIFKGNLTSRGTLSGAALTIMSGNSYLLGNVGIGTVSPSEKLEVVGTISGVTVYAAQSVRSSGSIVWEGTASGAMIRGLGLVDCDTEASQKLMWDTTTGKFSCGTDQGGTLSAGQGLTIAAGIARLNAVHSGTTITATTLLSGAIVHAQNQLRSSGSVVAQTTGLFKGTLTSRSTISGAALTVMGGNSYFLGNVSIGASTSTERLEVIGTASGRILHAQDQLRSSGTLLVEGDAFLSQALPLPLCDGTNACVTGSGAMFPVPKYLNGFTLSGAYVYAAYAGTTGVMKMQVRNMTKAVDMFTTLDLGHTRTSSGSSVSGVQKVNTGDRLLPFVSQLHSTPAKGVTLMLYFYPQ